MRRPLALTPVALVALLAGCGQGTGKDTASDFSGAQRPVAQAVEDLQAAGEKSDEGKICSDLLAEALVQRFERAGGGDCGKAVQRGIDDTDAFEIKVDEVAITGSTATAVVTNDRGSKDTRSTIRLVREGRPLRWKVASLG